MRAYPTLILSLLAGAWLTEAVALWAGIVGFILVWIVAVLIAGRAGRI